MFKILFVNRLKQILLVGFVLFCASCVSTKNVSYFQDIAQGQTAQLRDMAKFSEPIIQPDDILSIQLFSLDPQSTQLSNQASSLSAMGASSLTNNNGLISGFLVDKSGEIELVGIGKIKLAGLTTFQAKDLIREKAKALYNNVTIEVRFANFKVTVLGEVNRPAVYTMPNERVTLLDAIGLAGDLTIYGKRENILLIRNQNGQKEFVRFDLNSTNLMSSPYFYLKQNDVIYIEPNKSKAASLNAARTQTFAIIGSTLSLLVVILTRL